MTGTHIQARPAPCSQSSKIRQRTDPKQNEQLRTVQRDVQEGYAMRTTQRSIAPLACRQLADFNSSKEDY